VKTDHAGQTSAVNTEDHRPHVIIIGGGMAGLHAARVLRTTSIRLTVIEPTGHHQFLTRLAAVAAGTQPAGDAAAPLAAMLPGVATEPSRAMHIEEGPEHARVVLQDARVLDADAVIVTAGAETQGAPIDGFERALTLRSATDAITIRRSLGPSARPQIERLIVIGGGATGCQLASAAAVAHPDLDITLVEAAVGVLGGFRPALGRHAANVMRRRGVDLRCGTAVEAITEKGATLAVAGQRSHESLDGLVIWAGGVRAAGDVFGFGETRDGRLLIDETGRAMGTTRVFAAGDIAAHTDRRGHLQPMSAQIAAQAGRGVGKNVDRFLTGHSLHPLSLNDLGWVVDLGGGRGVADVLGIPLADDLTARLVPLLHTAIDYRNLFQLGGIDFMRRFGPGNANTPTMDELTADLAEFGMEIGDAGFTPS
jgi:NADH dehydrogenase